MNIVDLPNVSAEIKTYFGSLSRKYPVRSIWASQIGDPCERFLYHALVDWEQRRPIEPEKHGIFELGKHLEELGADFLKKTGWKVMESPDGYTAHNISGKIDRFITRKDTEAPLLKNIPVEIKWLYSANHNTWQDMRDSDKRWVMRYPAQLMTYMYLRASRFGLFLAYEKLTAEPHHIWIDFESPDVLIYIESLLKKADRVWAAAQAKEAPERIDPNIGICLDCDYFAACMPPVFFGQGVTEIADKDLLRILQRMEKIHPQLSEYKELEKLRKAALKDIKQGVCGPYLIEGKLIKRGSYTVQPSQYMMHKIKKLGIDNTLEDVFAEPTRRIVLE